MARKVIDQAMCDRAKRLAAVHALQEVAAIIGVHPSQITRMRKRGWIAATHRSRIRRRPGDFAIQSAHMTYAELQAHYRCGASTLTRWFAETPHRRPSWKGDALRHVPNGPHPGRGKRGTCFPDGPCP